MLIIALAGLVAAVALVIYTVFAQAGEKATVRDTLRSLGDYEVANIRDQELLEPFALRALKPVRLGIVSLGKRFTPQGYVATAQRKLITAGKPGADALDRFLAIRVLTIALIPVWLLFYAFFLNLEGMMGVSILFLVPAMLLLGPDATLNRQVEDRKHKIRVKLPDILDLLVISVEAGLGFDQALDRTVAAVPGPLSEEFNRMLGETRAGSTRADAMRAMDDRCDVTEVRSFVLAILQADTFGVSIGRVLRAQAEEMRIRRRQMAQEEAQKAPVKMMLPLVFCIFPSLLVVVLGPAIINIYEKFV